MADRFFAVQYFDGKLVELIIELSSSNEFLKINVLLLIKRRVSCSKNLLVSSTPSPDQMPGY